MGKEKETRKIEVARESILDERIEFMEFTVTRSFKTPEFN